MMQIKAKVTRNGQVTIPKAVRDKFRVEEGDTVTFDVEDGRVVLRFVDPEPVSPEDAKAIRKGLEQLLRGDMVEYRQGMYDE